MAPFLLAHSWFFGEVLAIAAPQMPTHAFSSDRNCIFLWPHDVVQEDISISNNPGYIGGCSTYGAISGLSGAPWAAVSGEGGCST